MKFAFLAAVILLVSCKESNNEHTYTLYRASPLDKSMRVHMATFDANEGGTTIPEYNKENCELIANLFSSQPGVEVKYWCEKGRFRQ